MPEKNPIFDTEMDELIVALVDGGLTYQEIADFIGLTRSMIFKRNYNHLHAIPQDPKEKIMRRDPHANIVRWQNSNPGYQDGVNNLSYGRIVPQEEIERKVVGFRKNAAYRKGKKLSDVYGPVEAARIAKAASDGLKRFLSTDAPFTKPEQALKTILDATGVAYEPHKLLGYYVVDFYIPAKKLVIQVDGCFWHGCPIHFPIHNEMQRKNQWHDKRCNSYLKNHGYEILRVWECDIPHFKLAV